MCVFACVCVSERKRQRETRQRGCVVCVCKCVRDGMRRQTRTRHGQERMITRLAKAICNVQGLCVGLCLFALMRACGCVVRGDRGTYPDHRELSSFCRQESVRWFHFSRRPSAGNCVVQPPANPHAHARVHTPTYMSTHTRTHVHMHMYQYLHTFTRVDTCTDMHTCTRTRARAHTPMCTSLESSSPLAPLLPHTNPTHTPT